MRGMLLWKIVTMHICESFKGIVSPSPVLGLLATSLSPVLGL